MLLFWTGAVFLFSGSMESWTCVLLLLLHVATGHNTPTRSRQLQISKKPFNFGKACQDLEWWKFEVFQRHLLCPQRHQWRTAPVALPQPPLHGPESHSLLRRRALLSYHIPVSKMVEEMGSLWPYRLAFGMFRQVNEVNQHCCNEVSEKLSRGWHQKWKHMGRFRFGNQVSSMLILHCWYYHRGDVTFQWLKFFSMQSPI